MTITVLTPGGNTISEQWLLSDLIVEEISLVDEPANPGARIEIFKRAPMATVGGKEYPASAFAYVPDAQHPSTWKLPIFDAAHVSAAAAAFSPGGHRGQRVEIPSDERAAVLSRIRAAWRKFNPDKSDEEMPDSIKKHDGDDMSEFKEQIDALTKRLEAAENANVDLKKANEDLTFLVGLSVDEREFFAGLDKKKDAEVIDQFRKGDADARAKLIKGPNPDELPAIVKQALAKADEDRKAMEKRLADAEQVAKDEMAKREMIELRTQADREFPFIPGTTDERAAILKSIQSLPESEQARLMDILKSNNALSQAQITAQGFMVHEPSSAEGRLDELAKAKQAAAGGKLTFESAYDEVLQTPEGKKLYQESIS